MTKPETPFLTEPWITRRVAAGWSLALAVLVWLLVTTLFNSTMSDPLKDGPAKELGAHLLEADGDKPAPALKGRVAHGAGEPGGGASPPPPIDLLTADRSRDLHGVVVKSGGTPIAGADLQVLYYPWRYEGALSYERFFESRPGPATKSARDGTFSLRFGCGDHVHLKASAAGFAQYELAMLQAGESVRLVLSPAVRLRIRALGPDGLAAGDLELRIFRGGRGEGTSFDLRQTTDAEGRATFESLPPDVQFHLDPRPTREGWGYPGWIQLHLPADGEMSYELELPAGRTLRGRVTDSVTARPVVGARIGMNWVLAPQTLSDDDGRYVLHGWTGKGVSDVHVLAKGYGRAQADVGIRETLDFALVPGGKVTGRILGDGGKPLARARVSAVGSQRVGGAQSISASSGRTGEEGRFTLGDLRRDMAHTVIVHAPGHAKHLLQFTFRDVKDAVDLGDIHVPQARMLIGRIVRGDGQPVPRLRLSLSVNPPDPHGYGRNWSRRTDDLGRFTFTDLAAGSYTLRTLPSGAPSISHSVEVRDTDEPTEVTLTTAETVELRVFVVDDEGTPLPGLYVHGSGVRKRTNGEGLAVLKLSGKPGLVHVGVREEDHFLPPKPVQLTEGQKEVQITLQRAVFTTGRVLDPKGRPVPLAVVHVERDSKTEPGGQADEQGAFSIRLRPDEAVALVFEGQVGLGGRMRWQTKQIALAGRLDGVYAGAKSVVLRAHAVASDLSLTIRVLNPDGSGIEGATVFRRGTGRPIGGSAKTDSEGRATFEGLMATPVLFNVWFTATRTRPWVLPSSKPLTAVPANQEMVVRMLRGTPIEGVLLKEDGTPAPGGIVEARAGKDSLGSAAADSDGRWVLLVDGERTAAVTLSSLAQRPDRSRLRAEATEVRPGSSGVTLRLKPVE